MKLREFLSNFGFDYKEEKGLISLIDKQGGNINNIEGDKFNTVEDIIDRLETYIIDDQVEGIDYELELKGVDLDSMPNMSLEDKVKLADEVGAEVYDYYRAILNPYLIDETDTLKKNKRDIEVKFLTRGDDLEMLNKAMEIISWENEDVLSYLAYLKFSIVEQLGIELPKEEYPIGHKKGYSEEEFEEYLDELLD